MTRPTEIRILSSKDDLFQAAADEFANLAQSTVRERGRFTVALSGGSTPKGMHELLSSGAFPKIPWDKVFFFFGDERYVPPDHPESNDRMANETLLSKVAAKHVFRMPTEERDPEVAARAYEKTLIEQFHLAPGEFPRFDLVILGLGPDGHTASLFPASRALDEKRHLVVANWVEKFQSYRITLTYHVINNAANVMFLVSGSDKTSALHRIFEDNATLPARSIPPEQGRLIWLLDREAAGKVSFPAHPG